METKEQLIESLEKIKDEVKAEYGLDACFNQTYIRCERHIELLNNQEKLNEKFKNAKIKKNLWEFEGEVEHLDDIVRATEEGKNVFIWGNPGCGKTFAASAFLKQQICKMKTCKLLHAYHLEQDLWKSSSFSYDGKDPMKEAVETEYVVIDDMGLEKPTEYIIKLLFQVINDREDNGLTTIMISNFDQQNLVKRFSSYTENIEYVQALASRMFGNCEIINFTGSDRRFK